MGSAQAKLVWRLLPSRDFPKLVGMYLQVRLNLDLFVSETIQLDGVEAAFGRMQQGLVLRSVVLP